MKKSYFISFILFISNSLFCLAQNPLLGMTYGGGAHSCGTIFKMNFDGSGFQTIYSFNTQTGMYPYGSLLQSNDGKLYGMTSYGGATLNGVIFSFDLKDSIYKDLVDFNDTNGAAPYGSLIQATDGKLYGMTAYGGASGYGVLFSLDPGSNSYSVLIDFNDSIGEIPKGDLIQTNDGKIYGLTSGGGNNGLGVLFRFDPETYLYSKLIDFNITNGKNPYGSLIKAENGVLYGTTRQGGINSAGVIFSFNTADSSYSKLLDFAGGNNESPSSSLLQANNGNFYGMTIQGGLNNIGSIYSFDTLGNIYGDVLDFDTANGASPSYNTLMQASNNKLYGMTLYGGANNDGVAFSFNPADSTYSKLVDFNGTNGKYPGGTLIELQTITGINAQPENVHLIIYPNPAKKELRITNPALSGTSSELRMEKLDIYNMLGMKIYSREPETAGSKLETVIDVSALSPGIYFVKVNDASGSSQSIGRFVKE